MINELSEDISTGGGGVDYHRLSDSLLQLSFCRCALDVCHEKDEKIIYLQPYSG